MRKLALAVIVLVTLGWPSAVSADRPTEDHFSVTFDDMNPCSGEMHEVTLNFEIFRHEGHKNNNDVVHLRRSGTTSSGFEMIAGNEQQVDSEQGFRAHFMDMWADGDGARFQVSGHININGNTDEVVAEGFKFRCISGGS